MNTFDKILASGYYVFGRGLNCHLIRHFITSERMQGVKLNRNELVMDEIEKYMYFDNFAYKLKDECDVCDIALFIDWNMVVKFHNLKKAWDNYHNNQVLKEQPTFEKAMEKIDREEPIIENDIKKLIK